MKRSLWFKKAIAICLVGVIGTSVVACSTTSETSTDATGGEVSTNDTAVEGEPITITALSTWTVSDIRPVKDQTLVGQWLEEELNMDLELVTIPDEAVTTKINALAASGDLPTILFSTGDSDSIAAINDVGAKGVYVNVMDYLDQVPNYAAYLEDDVIRREMTDVNGDIYGFAKIYTDNNIMYTTPIIREDLLEGSEWSHETITTIDDLTNVLVYLTEKTGTPAWIQRNGYQSFMETSGYLWNLDNHTFYDYTTDSYAHPITQEQTKEYVEWLKELREKEVIHPDWAIMTDETWEGLLASDKGSFTIDRMSIIGDNNFSQDFDWQPVLYPEINGEAYLQPNQKLVLPGSSWVVNANASEEEIDKALEFIDFLYDEENHNVLTLGIEGETYTTEDPNTMAGIRWLIQIYGENADNEEADFLFEHGIQSFTRLQTPVDMQSFPGAYPEIMYNHIDVINEEQGGFRPQAPTLAFEDDVQTKLSTLEASLNTYYDENIIAFIEGKRDMSEWDDFVAEVMDRGVEEVVNDYNDAYAAYKLR